MTSQALEYLYLDYSATSPLRAEAFEAMLPYLREQFGNPSSIHRPGRDALAALENARQGIANVLGAERDEIVFTSGGSESDNLALRGVAFARDRTPVPPQIITSAVEHEAVLETCTQLHEQLGLEITLVPVDKHGRVNPADVERAMTERTILVSVMHANNEVGTLQPIGEIARLAHTHGVLFHTDAVQAAGSLALNVRDLDCDLLSLSAHKFGGPRGTGILYVRRGTKLSPQVTGGGQEGNRRSGTEYVAGAVGMSVAFALAQGEREQNVARLYKLRDTLIEKILALVKGAWLTGHPTERLAGHASFVMAGVESQALLLALDQQGIGASAGSACTVGKQTSSHVLHAMGVPEDLQQGALRLTLSPRNTEQDIERVCETLPRVVAKVRTMLEYEPKG